MRQPLGRHLLLCPDSSVPDLLYELNARDEISSVNEEWLPFALANGGEPLDPVQIMGRLVWDFISDVETQHIYRLLHRRVRAGGAPVRLCFRCDAPARRRLLDLEISAGPERRLIYRVRTLREQERQPVALLEPYPPRSEHFVTICAWCERVAVPAHGWLEIEAAIAALPALAEARPPQLTHAGARWRGPATLRCVGGRAASRPIPGRGRWLPCGRNLSDSVPGCSDNLAISRRRPRD